MTGFEKLKQMKPEELADFLSKDEICNSISSDDCHFEFNENCYECYIKYLTSEIKETGD